MRASHLDVQRARAATGRGSASKSASWPRVMDPGSLGDVHRPTGTLGHHLGRRLPVGFVKPTVTISDGNSRVFGESTTCCVQSSHAPMRSAPASTAAAQKGPVGTVGRSTIGPESARYSHVPNTFEISVMLSKTRMPRMFGIFYARTQRSDHRRLVRCKQAV